MIDDRKYQEVIIKNCFDTRHSIDLHKLYLQVSIDMSEKQY